MPKNQLEWLKWWLVITILFGYAFCLAGTTGLTASGIGLLLGMSTWLPPVVLMSVLTVLGSLFWGKPAQATVPIVPLNPPIQSQTPPARPPVQQPEPTPITPKTPLAPETAPILARPKDEEEEQAELQRRSEQKAKRQKKATLAAKIAERTAVETKPLKDRHEQLKAKLEQAAHDPLGGKIQIPGMNLNIDKYAKDKEALAETERQLAILKEGNIKALAHSTPRAFRELPHFFKFPLVKAHPRRSVVKTSLGQMQFEPITEMIDFQQVKAEVTYYGGELGDQDRMVWLAVMNQAIRNRDFVKEFGWIPFSREDIANEIGLNDTARKAKVSDSLERLALTRIKFNSPFGDFAFKGAFHLLDSVVSVEARKVKADINDKLLPMLPTIETPNPVITPEFANQAKTMLERIKPKAPKINLIRFHANLMDAILGNQVTTVDLWAIKDFSPSEKTLFLYLYDISQWRTSNEPLAISLQELMTLLDLKPHIREAKGKDYTEWNRSKKLIESAMLSVETTLKQIIDHSWEGEGEKAILLVQFAKHVKQIPNAPE